MTVEVDCSNDFPPKKHGRNWLWKMVPVPSTKQLGLVSDYPKMVPKIALMSPCNGNVNHHDEPRQCCRIWAPWDHMFHFAPVGFVENIYHTFPWSSCHGRDRPISVVRQQLYATKNLSHFGKNLGGSSNSSLITFWETIVIQPFLGYNIIGN
jgi:hypothetical protein